MLPSHYKIVTLQHKERIFIIKKKKKINHFCFSSHYSIRASTRHSIDARVLSNSVNIQHVFDNTEDVFHPQLGCYYGSAFKGTSSLCPSGTPTGYDQESYSTQ